nr:glycosyltransferase family 2 protein [uncultured Desulfobulbus sp.]
MAEKPIISVVTSCFNGEEYIEKTIRSIVEQGYSNLEYILIDGASTDHTVDVARKFEDKISLLISEPDEGQYYGIQKGLNLASGQVMAFLNADDAYYPWTFSVVGEIFQHFPQVQWLIGTPSYMNTIGQCTKISSIAGVAYSKNYIKNGWYRQNLAGYLQQESMFWRKELWDHVGGFDLNLKYAADFDLWRKFAKYADLYSLTVPLALFRQRPGKQRSSLGADVYKEEVRQVCQNLKKPPLFWEQFGENSVILRNVLRMIIWKNAYVISYSRKQERWIVSERMRPLARSSFLEALLDFQIG